MRQLFKGWYFKHQNKDETLAVIPGYCKDHAFIQILTNQESHIYNFSSLQIRNGSIYIGDCSFSREGIVLLLPDIEGTITYGPLLQLSSDIMGPFRFFPMECRHSVISMNHTTTGTVMLGEKAYCFDQGKGYMEGDSGSSFPSSYLWLHCNDFVTPCSIMVSIATIPFYGLHFTGCICAITYQGKEYRLATYNGVRILAATTHHICLSQHRLLLEIEIQAGKKGKPLLSPKAGLMSGTIHESCDARIRVRLWENHRLIVDERSRRASFECMVGKG